jgi:hypothetical protein
MSTNEQPAWGVDEWGRPRSKPLGDADHLSHFDWPDVVPSTQVTMLSGKPAPTPQQRTQQAADPQTRAEALAVCLDASIPRPARWKLYVERVADPAAAARYQADGGIPPWFD